MCLTLSRMEQDFFMYRAFFPFTPNGSHISFLSNIWDIVLAFIVMGGYIRILTYMTYLIYDFFICVPYGYEWPNRDNGA